MQMCLSGQDSMVYRKKKLLSRSRAPPANHQQQVQGEKSSAIFDVQPQGARSYFEESRCTLQLPSMTDRVVPYGPITRSAHMKTAPSLSSLIGLQCEEGYWLLNEALGQLIHINVNYLIDIFLMKNGICSLGSKGKEEVLKLIATLLVLQHIRSYSLLKIKFKNLTTLDESFSSSEFYQEMEKAIKWARKTDRQYSGVCSRLGLGKNWDSATRKLLSIDPLDPSSDLRPAIMY
ncbi:hypothetical protein GDO86_004619 [Hymenochirus boettgeri]|uniref:PARP4 MVP-ID C-terminal domain-containing protein n=1 Tax=Hymenochirus boettgeri TaxID=247094 RepID=A0A8T2K6Q5_9PIPI|nr:hypothetical protein GDO86_004619 [Hymenochirus boettgeri]